MDPDRHLQLLRTATERVRDSLDRADPHAPVPTCPGWDVTALVEHLGGVHLWAEEAARTATRPERMPSHEDDGRTLADWYADAADILLDTLARLDVAAPAWTFADGDRTVGFWRRRQLHETLVHAADLALAGRQVGDLSAQELYAGVDPDVAADGIAELLEVFLPRMARGASQGGRVSDVIPAPAPIVLTATDADVSWTLRATDSEFTATSGASADAVAALAGPAADLNLAMWRRAGWDRIDRGGDQVAAAAFVDGLRLP